MNTYTDNEGVDDNLFFAEEPQGEYSRHNTEMNLAWQFVARTGVSVFLTGKAGTGKTTFLRKIRELSPKRMVVLAPTGVAAINARGQTIHSFFQFSFGPFIPGTTINRDSKAFKMAQWKKDLIRTLDLLVIDEVSMVRADLLDQIDDALRKYRDPVLPFGGVQLLLIGDLMQLAPVVKGEEWDILKGVYDTPYFFSSLALKRLQYVTVELRHIYRQQDQEFIDLLGAVRCGNMTQDVIDKLNRRYIPSFKPEGGNWINLTTHNATANEINRTHLDALSTPIHSFEAHFKGDFPEANFPADKTLNLKAGAQVMFIKNDPSMSHAYYNGKIGTVTGFGEGTVTIQCPDDASPITLSPVEWENTKYILDPETKEIKEDVVGTFSQFPLRLAWAITVHKSQGLTFDRAVLDVNRSFTHGQVYVALSRCRSLEGLVLASPLHPSSVITDNTVDRYIGTQSAASAQSISLLPSLKQQYAVKLLDELYNLDDIARAFRWLTRVVDEHLSKQQPELLDKLKALDPPFEKDLARVAASFRGHYILAMQQGNGVIDNTPLADRIKSSAEYFHRAIHETFDPILQSLVIAIENRSVTDIYKNAVKQLCQALSLKLTIFDRLKDITFSVPAYLDIKAKAMLDNGEAKLMKETKRAAKKEKKPKKEKTDKPKQQKGDSARLTKSLYDSGKTPEEIAAERSLSLSTILSHLGDYVLAGEIGLDALVSPEQQKTILDAANTFDDAYHMADLMELLPDDISAGQVMITLRKHNLR